jgi:membrane protein
MAITHRSPVRPQSDKKQLFAAVARLAAVSFAAWQRRRQGQAMHLSAPMQSAAALPASLPTSRRQAQVELGTDKLHDHYADHGSDHAAGNTAKAESKKPGKADAGKKDEADLRKESRPKALFHIMISAAKEWSSHRAASKGAALALYTLFSLAPMLVLVVTIAGFFFGEDTVRDQLFAQMSGLMGPQGADAIKTILAGAKHEDSGAIAGLISAALVLISATTAFAELKESLDELWEVPKKESSGLWSLVRERFLSFGLVLVLALMALTSLAVSTALAAMGNVFGGGAEGTALKVISTTLSYLMSFAIVAGLFAAIFKYLPDVKLSWRDVAIGALLTAALFTIGKFAIGLYVAKADISSSYGAAGSVVILITWIYYSAQIFFYGSLFTHEYATKLGSMADKGKASGNSSEGGKNQGSVASHSQGQTPALVRPY